MSLADYLDLIPITEEQRVEVLWAMMLLMVIYVILLKVPIKKGRPRKMGPLFEVQNAINSRLPAGVICYNVSYGKALGSDQEFLRMFFERNGRQKYAAIIVDETPTGEELDKFADMIVEQMRIVYEGDDRRERNSNSKATPTPSEDDQRSETEPS